MTFEELRYLVEAEKYHSFSAAAEKLHISPQGLSQGVRHLEQELGIVLFERSSSGVRLTETGRQIVRESEQIINSLNRIQEISRMSKSVSCKMIRCLIRSSRLGHVLKNHLDIYQEKTGQRIKVCPFSDLHQAIKALKRNEADVLFEFEEVMEREREFEFCKEPLFQNCSWPILSRKNPLTKKKKIQWKDLEGTLVMVESEKSMTTLALYRKMQENKIQLKLQACYEPVFCMEGLKKDFNSIYFSTSSLARQFCGGFSEFVCCDMEDPPLSHYAAYMKHKEQLGMEGIQLLEYVRENMKDYSAAPPVESLEQDDIL